MGETDARSIQNAVDHAKKTGIRSVTIPRINQRTGNPLWEIDQAIRLPSDMELVLEDCHLRMADGVYSNMFVNKHQGTELGRTPEGIDRNITILGKGNAILDGGKYNGLSEKITVGTAYPTSVRTICCCFPMWTALPRMIPLH